MASVAVFFAGALISGAVTFTGGWVLRGLRDRYRAEIAQMREDGHHGR
jgi:hypothetical protein